MATAAPLHPDAPAQAAPRLKLYEATEQLDTVREWLVESEGELTPEIEALLEQAGQDFDAKAERVALMVRELVAEAAGVGVEADRLIARQKAANRSADALKAYLLREMQRAGRETIKRPLVTLAVTNNSAASVGVPDLTEEQLREIAQARPELVRVVPETLMLDKAAITAAWKADPAVKLPAGVTVSRGQHLRIR